MPHSTHNRHDGPLLASSLAELQRRPELSALPVFAFGASSGGTMAFLLPAYVPGLRAVAVQIAAVPASMIPDMVGGERDGGGSSPDNFPATLFLHMERDQRTSQLVADDVATLRELGVSARSIVLKPAKIDASFFEERGLMPAVAAEIVSRFERGGLLDSAGKLKEDPRRSSWRDLLREPAVPGLASDSLMADKSPVSELLNVAWAQHELFAAPRAEMLRWFQDHQHGPVT